MGEDDAAYTALGTDGTASNDRWVACGLGHRHWGAAGAAGVLLTSTAEDGMVRYLLQLRSPLVHHGGTWGLPGGAIKVGETSLRAALRETAEETGVPLKDPVVLDVVTDDHGGWTYTTFIIASSHPAVTGRTDEQEETRWFTAAEALSLPLHQGLARGPVGRRLREAV